ncbi:MAG: cytochrome c oxidase assembly protein [Caldilineaceae bacterium]|nr:cytochrome c oxidase assembly protein [Caldilineaceae bacterium]
MSIWVVRLAIVAIVGSVGWYYLRGWQRLRRAGSPLGHWARLGVMGISGSLILLATFPPLYPLSHELLYARATQKILVAMVAAPLFWLASPLHIILRGWPFAWRRRVIYLFRSDTRSGRLIRLFTSTGVAWMLYVGAIVIWHDSHVINWTMTGTSRHYLTLLFMFGAALLYWVHIVGTGFRLRRALPGWVLFAYAVGVEIPNMTAGITIAYSSTPLYAHYVESARRIGNDVLGDQVMAGGLVWFMGSVVFFFSAVMIVNRIFLRHGSTEPEYFPEWDSDDRMIAPGLEHRLEEKR